MPADANIGGIHYRPPVNRSSSLPAPPRTSTTSPQYRPPPPPPSRGFSGAIGRIAQAVSPRGVAQTRAQRVTQQARRTGQGGTFHWTPGWESHIPYVGPFINAIEEGLARPGGPGPSPRQAALDPASNIGALLTYARQLGVGGRSSRQNPSSSGFSSALGRIAQTVGPVVRPPGGGGDITNPRYIGFGGTQNAPVPGFTGPNAGNWNRNNPWQMGTTTPPVPQQYRIAARSWGLSPNDPNLVPKINALKARVLQQSPRATPNQSRAANQANQLYTLGDTLAGTFGQGGTNPFRRLP